MTSTTIIISISFYHKNIYQQFQHDQNNADHVDNIQTFRVDIEQSLQQSRKYVRHADFIQSFQHGRNYVNRADIIQSLQQGRIYVSDVDIRNLSNNKQIVVKMENGTKRTEIRSNVGETT